MTVAKSANNEQLSGMTAPLSGNSVAYRKAHVSYGIREVKKSVIL